MEWIKNSGRIKQEKVTSDGVIYVVKHIETQGAPLKLEQFADRYACNLKKRGSNTHIIYNFDIWDDSLEIWHSLYFKHMRIIISNNLNKVHRTILEDLETILFSIK